MKQRNRIIMGVVFVFFMMVCGLVAAVYFGGKFLVPRDSGLAGSAMVVGYGLVGAVLGGVVGGFLAYALPLKGARSSGKEWKAKGRTDKRQ
jgi:hypothetical protein